MPATATVGPKAFRMPRSSSSIKKGGEAARPGPRPRGRGPEVRLPDLAIPAIRPLVAELVELVPVGCDELPEARAVREVVRQVPLELDSPVAGTDGDLLGVHRLDLGGHGHVDVFLGQRLVLRALWVSHLGRPVDRSLL